MVTYEPGFKEQAVKMPTEVGAAKAAQDLGMPTALRLSLLNTPLSFPPYEDYTTSLAYCNP